MDKPLTLFDGFTGSKLDRQILAITRRVAKAKNPGKAKQKVRELQLKQRRSEWLGQ